MIVLRTRQQKKASFASFNQECLTFSESQVSDKRFSHSSSLALHTVQKLKQIMEWYTNNTEQDLTVCHEHVWNKTK